MPNKRIPFVILTLDANTTSQFEIESNEELVVAQNFLPITIFLEKSSSSVTVGNTLAVNEVFNIQIQSILPFGVNDIMFATSKSSRNC